MKRHIVKTRVVGTLCFRDGQLQADGDVVEVHESRLCAAPDEAQLTAGRRKKV